MMQAALFEGIETVTPEERRESRLAEQKRKAKLAYAATSERWKEAVYDFAVEEFLPTHATFVFEELSLAYDGAAKTYGWPLTVEPRAFAGIQQRLVREGLIVNTTKTRNRTQGTPAYVYQSNSFGG